MALAPADGIVVSVRLLVAFALVVAASSAWLTHLLTRDEKGARSTAGAAPAPSPQTHVVVETSASGSQIRTDGGGKAGLAESILGAFDVGESLRSVSALQDLAREHIGTNFCRIFMYDGENQDLHYVRISQRKSGSVLIVSGGGELQLVRVSADTTSLAGRAALSRQPQWARTDGGESAHVRLDLEIDGQTAMHTLLAVPLVVSGACAGVCVVGRAQAPLGDLDLRALERFASLVAPAVFSCWQYLGLQYAHRASARGLENALQEHAIDVRTREYLLRSFTGIEDGPLDVQALDESAGQSSPRGSECSSFSAFRTRRRSSVTMVVGGDVKLGGLFDYSTLDAALPGALPALQSWDLDAWEHEADELIEYLVLMLHTMGLLARFQVPPSALRNFLAEADAHYNANPFHNFRHVFTVTHKLYLMLMNSQLRKQSLEDVDCLAVMLAAVCHDLEHPATNNAFQVNSRSELATTYNDVHVLENHHCSCAFRILQQEGCGVTEHLNAHEQAAFRRIMIGSILATDMKVHAELCKEVDAKVAHAKSTARSAFAKEAPDDRLLLCKFLLHCADLSNPLASPPVSRRLANLVTVEFNSQAERERALGLPVTALEAYNEADKAKLERSFIGFAVRPLYCTLAEIAPPLILCVERIDEVINMWQTVV